MTILDWLKLNMIIKRIGKRGYSIKMKPAPRPKHYFGTNKQNEIRQTRQKDN